MTDEEREVQVSRFLDAAKKGADEIIEQLLDDPSTGVQVHATDSLGETALHWASRAGHETTVQLLLDRGAQVNVSDRTGETPLHKAAWRNQYECIKLLVEHGADVSVENREGKKPVDLAKEVESRVLLLPPVFVEEGEEEEEGADDPEDEDSD